MQSVLSNFRSERGQVLILSALVLTLLLGILGLAVDVGFHFSERRQVQNAADQATRAAAYELSYGGTTADAIGTALQIASANGYNNDGVSNKVTVNIPPTTGEYVGNTNAIEVVIDQLNVPTFFIQAIIPSTSTIRARGVAVLLAGAASDPNAQPLPIPLPNIACDDTGATVDGRVTANETYNKVASIVGGTTDYGSAYFACDGAYYYFGLELNALSATGVANENVYGGCKLAGSGQISGNTIDKLEGIITALGANSFTLDSNGTIWTIDVDGSTTYKAPLNAFGDLTVAQHVEIKRGTIVAPQQVLAEEIKDKAYKFCSPTSNQTYQSDYNTGWANDAHTFEKLLKSDRARFQLSCDGVPVHDFIQDYLRQVGGQWVSDPAGDGSVVLAGPDQSASSLEWNLENPASTGWGDDPGEKPLEQSPPFNPSYGSVDAEYNGWVWEMLYEFRVPVAAYSGCTQVTFGMHNFGGQAGPLEGIHSSPAKTADSAFLRVEPFDVRLVE